MKKRRHRKPKRLKITKGQRRAITCRIRAAANAAGVPMPVVLFVPPPNTSERVAMERAPRPGPFREVENGVRIIKLVLRKEPA